MYHHNMHDCEWEHDLISQQFFPPDIRSPWAQSLAIVLGLSGILWALIIVGLRLLAHL